MYRKMICENLFPSINQFNFLRKTFPSNDYFNPFLRDIGQEEGRETRLEAMLFSDTSEMVSQIVNQHCRLYGRIVDLRTPHQYRALSVFNFLRNILVVSQESQIGLAKIFSKMSSSDIFEIYRNIAILIEGVTKNPENLLTQKLLIDQSEVIMAMIMT